MKSFVEKSISCEVIVDMLQGIPEILPPAYKLLENWQKNRDSRMRNTYRLLMHTEHGALNLDGSPGNEKNKTPLPIHVAPM